MTIYVNGISGGSGSGVTTYTNLAAFPATASDGSLGVALDTHILYIWNGAAWVTLNSVASGGNLTETTSTSLTITGGTGAVLGSGTTIQVKSAGAAQAGVVTTGAQTLAGAKTFSTAPILSSLTLSTALALDASKNIVSVTNSGSGDNVLATSPTLITPALGTPTALVGTNITGTATLFTASNVTTNANLTGDVTSVGNAATVAKIQTTTVSGTTGSGNVVFSTSPTLVTPVLGTPQSGVATNLTGTASGLTAGNVTTNANLTGVITSSGNATSIASQTGTGSVFVVQNTPTLTTPNIGAATGTSLNLSGLSISSAVATDGSKNLVSVTNTGSGNNVLATSPTLVTPILGTPQSGNLSNCTALSLTAGVSGTLPVANGGTNKTSVTSAPAATSWAGWDANGNLSAINHINAMDSVATAGGTTTLAVNSSFQQYFTGSTTQTCVLPVASTLIAGQGFDLINASTGIVTVNTSGAVLVQALATNTRLRITCINASGGTGTASWKWEYKPLINSSGSGSKNYLSAITTVNGNNNGNGDAELGATTGWTVQNATMTSTTPTGAPTGAASGNLTVAVVTSSQLSGANSFNLSSSSTSVAGDMLRSAAFNIDTSDQAKMMSIRFNYKAVSGTHNMSGTSSNSHAIYIYDVTNSAWIQPAGVYNIVQSSGVGTAVATFQTSATGTSYYFCLVNINAISTSYSLYVDDIFVGPQAYPVGPAMSDWIAFTPTGSWVTNTTYTGYYSRVGDTLRCKVYWALAGAPNSATNLTINLPSGLTIDTTKLPNSNTRNIFGFGNASQDASSGNRYLCAARYNATTNIQVSYHNKDASNNILSQGSVSTTAPVTWASGDDGEIYFEVPIVGWSSNVSMSQDTDTRVVAAIITGDPASATSGNPLIVPTVGYDSHGSYSASTGRYTVPVSGIYKMFGALQSASSATTLTIYKNASSSYLCGNLDSNGEAAFIGSVNCVTGDIIDVRPGGTVDATNMTLSIERLSGPAVVAQNEAVNARYYASSTSVSGSLATISWTTKDFDSHNGMSSGTYTVPVTGKYQVSSGLLLAGTFALNSLNKMEIQKNGSVATRATVYSGGIVTDQPIACSDIVSCIAGDTLRIQISTGATGPSIVSSNFDNFMSIALIK